ncbi:hypothetical protein TGVAND_215580 [Toxoplasma gondii VAND]|uniref:Uncharacterized protein n=1 Tax=Toxoplasma gondii VAND TaxID=933077 RepID=A0A086Q5W3_TOXGO|nr:hypothetical protein TGVAND_215580 [Toxoplasma gondii VAND]
MPAFCLPVSAFLLGHRWRIVSQVFSGDPPPTTGLGKGSTQHRRPRRSFRCMAPVAAPLQSFGMYEESQEREHESGFPLWLFERRLFLLAFYPAFLHVLSQFRDPIAQCAVCEKLTSGAAVRGRAQYFCLAEPPENGTVRVSTSALAVSLLVL